MFSGLKFEALPKPEVGRNVGSTPHVLEQNHFALTGLINQIDQWAAMYGYEYHSMTDTCVVFKRLGG